MKKKAVISELDRMLKKERLVERPDVEVALKKAMKKFHRKRR